MTADHQASKKLEKCPKEKTPNVEAMLGCGVFQALVFLSYQMTIILQGGNMYLMAFGKAMPKRWACLDNITSDLPGPNGTDFSTYNESEQCLLLTMNNGCKNFTFVTDFYSVVTHYQLVCGKVKYVYLIMTLQMVGALIGCPVFGQLSDSFGRKWTLFGAVSTLIISGCASAFAPSWQIFAALRLMVGISAGGCIITNHVFVMEFLSKKHRLWLTNIGGWSFAYMMNALLAYLTQNFRTLALATNILCLPALALILLVGESPRWLVQRRRFTDAEKQLRRIAKLNGHVLDEDDINIIVSKTNGGTNGENQKQYTYWHLFSTRSMALHTAVLASCYFCISVISGGVLFNVDKLSGNMYINSAIMGSLRWTSTILNIVADLCFKKFGRKVGFLVPSISIAGCALAVLIVQTIGLRNGLSSTVSIMTMAMAFLNPPIWTMIYLSNAELFPTPIRNMALAFCSTFNRLGGVVVPQVLYLAHFWKPAPYTVFAIAAVTASVLFLTFVPETKGKPLPEQMPESRRMSLSKHGSAQRTPTSAYKLINAI